VRYGSESLTRWAQERIKEQKIETPNTNNSFNGFCHKGMERKRVLAREGKQDKKSFLFQGEPMTCFFGERF
jgi:hypothetical protein